MEEQGESISQEMKSVEEEDKNRLNIQYIKILIKVQIASLINVCLPLQYKM